MAAHHLSQLATICGYPLIATVTFHPAEPFQASRCVAATVLAVPTALRIVPPGLAASPPRPAFNPTLPPPTRPLARAVTRRWSGAVPAGEKRCPLLLLYTKRCGRTRRFARAVVDREAVRNAMMPQGSLVCANDLVDVSGCLLRSKFLLIQFE